MSKKINLEVTWVKIADLTAYKGNTKKHSPHQIQQIADSITEFGMNDPIGVWHHDGKTIVVEGHGRLQACLKLGYEEVPIISLDHLNDEQRRAYGIIHNQLTMLSGFDIDRLTEELEAIKNIDMKKYDLTIPEEPIDKGLDEIDDEETLVVDPQKGQTVESLFDQLTKEGYSCRLITL